jgi:hypothetical protein
MLKLKIHFDGKTKTRILYEGQWTPQYHSNRGICLVKFIGDSSIWSEGYDAILRVYYYDENYKT